MVLSVYWIQTKLETKTITVSQTNFCLKRWAVWIDLRPTEKVSVIPLRWACDEYYWHQFIQTRKMCDETLALKLYGLSQAFSACRIQLILYIFFNRWTKTGTSAGLLNAAAQIFGIGFTMCYAELLSEFGDIAANISMAGMMVLGTIVTATIKSDLRRQAAANGPTK